MEKTKREDTPMNTKKAMLQQDRTQTLPEETPDLPITDDYTADLAIKRVKECRAEYYQLRELCEQEIERIRIRIDEAKHRCEAYTNALEQKLCEYFALVPHAKTKTAEKYRLSSGTLALKYGGQKFEKDETALLAWLKKSGYTDYIKIAESSAWAELKKEISVIDGSVIITDTGEAVDGITVTRIPDRFSVE